MWAGLGDRPLVGRRWASVRQRTYLRKFDASAVHWRAGGGMAGSGHRCPPLLLTVSLPGYRGHVDLPNPVGATASVSAVVVSDVVHRHVGGVDTLMITVVKSHAMYFDSREKTSANNYDESADVGTVSQCRMLGSAGRGAA